jgi:hypothetical protein
MKSICIIQADNMHKDLDHLITNKIDINYNEIFDLKAHIE